MVSGCQQTSLRGNGSGCNPSGNWGRVAYYNNGKLHVYAQTHEDNSSQRHYDNRSEKRGFSDIDDQPRVRHADRRGHDDEGRGTFTDDHRLPMTGRRRYHEEDHHCEHDDGSHRDQTSHPDLPANRYTYQEDHRHNDRGRFPGAAGYYSPWETESDGFTAVDYYNTSYNACPPPAWIPSNPLYDQSTGLPPSMTAGKETTPVILEHTWWCDRGETTLPFRQLLRQTTPERRFHPPTPV